MGSPSVVRVVGPSTRAGHIRPVSLVMKETDDAGEM
jgi:hypothetical protein